MSILIKGMEMPTCCMFCPISNNVGCGLTNPPVIITSKEMLAGRPDWCPLVPVPPHGRLGDLDKLEQMFSDIDHAPYSGFDGEDPFYSAEDAAQIIRLAPTVIPASEKEELS